MKTAKRQTTVDDSSHYIERITDTGRITWLLTQLMEKRELLTLCIGGSQDKFTSAIINVDAGKGLARLDELMPRMGNKLMVKKCGIQASARLDGINMDFNMSLVDTGKQDGLIYFAVHMPKAVNYQQRRDTHRVRLPLLPDFQVILVSNDQVTEEGVLRDISHGGAQIILKSGSRVTPVKMLYECAVELPSGEQIYCSADVRYAMSFGNRNDMRVGIRFLDLTPLQQRIIDRCVASVELEFIRKRAL
ncbi:MAG: flagellar regulator YcgR PilZN domain-containing protein [Gammaproteobacteria bacterium]